MFGLSIPKLIELAAYVALTIMAARGPKLPPTPPAPQVVAEGRQLELPL